MTTAGGRRRLRAALADADADAFAHAGVADPDLTHCLGVAAPPSPPGAAVVYAPDDAVCAVASVDVARTTRRFPGRVTTLDGHPSDAVTALLAAAGVDGGSLLVPRHLPHDAAVALERAGYDVSATTAVADARALKSDAERDAVSRAGAAAASGLRRVAALLADASVEDGRLVADGTPVTADRLRREANAGASLAGGDGGATRVRTTDDDAGDALSPTDPVVVALAPQVEGYCGPVARTFVVDGDGGWERRAAVAAEMVHDAVRRVVEPDVPARRVVEEATAELGAYGFAPAEDVPVARGVGRTTHEAPDFETATLRAGHVFALDPVVADAETDRRVRLGELYAVTESGCERLSSAPASLSPARY